ncbi:MAG: hypothetical protein WCT13_05550 [Patescibacteria group bacterium]|jgi:hypothetical protein
MKVVKLTAEQLRKLILNEAKMGLATGTPFRNDPNQEDVNADLEDPPSGAKKKSSSVGDDDDQVLRMVVSSLLKKNDASKKGAN